MDFCAAPPRTMPSGEPPFEPEPPDDPPHPARAIAEIMIVAASLSAIPEILLDAIIVVSLNSAPAAERNTPLGCYMRGREHGRSRKV